MCSEVCPSCHPGPDLWSHKAGRGWGNRATNCMGAALTTFSSWLPSSSSLPSKSKSFSLISCKRIATGVRLGDGGEKAEGPPWAG